MNNGKLSNIETIILDSLRKLNKDFAQRESVICRKYSPHAGNGWLDKLSNLLLESYTETLQKLLDRLDRIVTEGYTMDDLASIKNLITHNFIKSIKESMLHSSFQTLLSENYPGRGHVLMIVDYLEQDIESSLQARVAMWKENKKIEGRKTKLVIFKELLRTVVQTVIRILGLR